MSENTNTAWAYTRRGHPSNTLEKHTRPIPAAAPGGIVIRTKAVSINPADYKMAGFPTWIRRAAGAPAYGAPCIPLIDFAGVVHQVGEGSAWKEGDEVLGRLTKMEGNGSLQQYLPIAADVPLIRKPHGVSWEQAAALPAVYITMYGCLVQRTGLPFSAPKGVSGRKRPSVLVLGGTTATGMVSIMLAKKMGLRIATTCSGSSQDMVEKLGATEIIDYKTQDIAVAALKADNAPFAVILDCVGGTELIPHMQELLLGDPTRPKLGQYISIVGDVQDQSNLDLYTAIPLLSTQFYRTLRGWLDPYIPSSIPFRSWIAGKPYAFHLAPPTQEILDTIPEFCREAGNLPIDEVFAFDKAKDAFGRVESGRAKGKVIVAFDG